MTSRYEEHLPASPPPEPEKPEGNPAPGEGDPVATGTKGGGEWPSPSTPPTDAAPGSDPDRAAAIREERRRNTT